MGARLRDDAAAVRFRVHVRPDQPLAAGQALAFFGLATDVERHIAGDLVRVHDA
jgi:hypothetical protein